MFRWIKNPRAFRWTKMPQIWDVRLHETDDQKARNDAEINAVVAYVVERSGGSAYPAPPPGDAAAGKKTFESVGCLGCHVVGDDKRGIKGIPSASFRYHGPHLDGTGSKLNAGWLYAWIRNPKAYWHDTKMPNLRLTREGGGRRHRLPHDPEERGLREPAPARPGPEGPRHHRGRLPAGAAHREAGRREARGHARRRAHAVPGREDDRPLRLLRLPHHRGLREGLAHRDRADRRGQQAGRAPRLRLRGRQDRPHPARLGAPQAHGASGLRRGQGEEAGRAAAHAEVPLHAPKRPTPSSPPSSR